MPNNTRWSVEELQLVNRYFTTNVTPLTLFQKLQQINPDRGYEAMMRRVRQMRTEGYDRIKERAIRSLRVGYLDIETTGLKGDFDCMLCWYIKAKGHRKFDHAVITKEELFNGTFDYRLTDELLTAFDNYDVLYTHYGADWRFDLPFIRTRIYKNKLESRMPRHMEKFILDTYPIARTKLKLHNNRLDSIAEMLDIPVRKTKLRSDVWFRAKYGDPEALEYVATHCRHDVILLERVHKKLEIIERPVYRSI